MASYRDIDDLLINTNKGKSGPERYTLPDPGDGVMVAVSDRGLLNVLVHHIDAETLICRGEIIGRMFDSNGKKLFDRAEYVTFSFKKVAGVHRG